VADHSAVRYRGRGNHRCGSDGFHTFGNSGECLAVAAQCRRGASGVTTHGSAKTKRELLKEAVRKDHPGFTQADDDELAERISKMTPAQFAEFERKLMEANQRWGEGPFEIRFDDDGTCEFVPLAQH
jgi:hypothetical protein